MFIASIEKTVLALVRAAAALAAVSAATGLAATSTLLYTGTNGRLTYVADARGNTIPDFSWCGYRGGGAAIPDAVVRQTLSPAATGDDRARIQTALNNVGALAPDANGLRGAVLLNAGVYRIGSGLTLPSGTVLRGAGQDPGGTLIIFTGPGGTMVSIGASGSPVASVDTASRQTLLDSYVPVGATRLRVANPSAFQPGNTVLVERPCKANWITAIGMDNISQRPGDPNSTQQWYAGKVDLAYERKVLAVDATTVTLDAPVVMAMETIYGGGTLVKFTAAARVSEAGVEKLRLMSQYLVGLEDTQASHVGFGIAINLAENCWVRQVTGRYFGGGTVAMLDPSIRITVEDCANLDPVSEITGGQRYSFYMKGQQALVQRCYSRKGRHDFITGTSTMGPNAYADCFSETTYADSGPHSEWATGTLYDNIKTDTLAVQDRDYLGSGQGWAGANHLLWNCDASIICQTPPTASNWALGCKGKRGNEFVPRPDGIFESWGVPITPRSIYMSQLQDRLGAAAVTNVTTAAQRAGSIITALNTRYDEVTPPVEWPWISSFSDRTINQDTHTGAITFTVGDAQTAPASLTLTGTSSQTTIVPNANIVFGTSGANRTVTVTPAPGQSGTVTITISVSDGALVATDSFNLTVASTVIGVPGTMLGLTNDANVREGLVVENAATGTTIMGSSGSDPWTDRCTVYVFQLPSAGAVNNPFITADFSFNYVSKSTALKNNDLYGLGRRAAATVLGSDYYGRTAVDDLTDATVIQAGILVDATPEGIITTSATGGTSLRNYLNAQYAGGAGAGQYVFLRVNTAAAPTSVSRATLTMAESGVVGPPDTRPQIDYSLVSPSAPPTISNVINQTTDEDTATAPIPFIIGDPDTPVTSLTVTATSSDTTLVPNANIVIAGTDANRTVTITPALNWSGTATITLTVSDGALSSVDTFNVLVNEDTDGDGLTDVKEVPAGRDPGSASDLGFEFNTDGNFERWGAFTRVTAPSALGGVLKGTISAADPFFSRNGFLFSGNSAVNLIVKIKFSAADSLQLFWGRIGSTGFTAGKSLTSSTSPANVWKAIVFPVRSHAEWAGQTITNLRLDPGNTADMSFEIDWVRASDGDLDGDGILDSSEAVGDSDGNGLLDIEDPNSPPTLSALADLTLSPGAASAPLAFAVSDRETAATALITTASSSNLTLVPQSGISINGTGANRTVTITPVANKLGTALITLNVNDGYATGSTTFTVNVLGTALQTWRFANFGTTANTGTAADLADSNRDGELNLLEFATGQDPNANTTTKTPLVRNGATVEFSYSRSLAAMAAGMTFSVEWSDTLASNSWSSAGVTEQLIGDNGTVQTVKATCPTGTNGKRFVRLKVTQP